MDSLLLPAVTLGATLALFVGYSCLVVIESQRGGRMLAPRLRSWLDKGVGGAARLRRAAHALTIYRRANRTADPSVAQALFRHATRIPLTVTYTNNHLSKIRDHKQENALTTAQKNKRKKQKLEERF